MALIRSVKVARSFSNARSQTSSVLVPQSGKCQQKSVGVHLHESCIIDSRQVNAWRRHADRWNDAVKLFS